MKNLVRVGLWTIAALVGLLVVALGALSAVHGAEYVWRNVIWLQSDAFDYARFPERPLQVAAEPFTFKAPLDVGAAEVEVRAAFQGDAVVGEDLDAFLEETRTRAFIVIRNDVVLYERYFNGTERDSIVTSFSMAKSFVSALVGIAIDEGYIKSVDDPITRYLPELAERDPRFEQITIRHLLNMSSGIKYNETGFIGGDDSLTYYAPNMRDLALNRTRIKDRPGESWLYNNYHPLLLGVILERATDQHVAEYLEAKLWQRLGMEYPGSWSLDSERSGFEKMESGINARAIDFAKFGRLYLHDGEWEGQQIVPRQWVEASTRMDPDIDRSTYYPPFLDQPYGQIYHQLLWWGVQQPDGDYGFSARGNLGQYIFVWPESDVIIVRNGERYGIDDLEWWRLYIQAAERLGAR